MQYRALGRTGIQVSVISFGCGPVSGLMTGDDAEAQHAVVAAALAAGINWFDTAPGYGQGQSEASLGRALAEMRAAEQVHIATKVRLPLDGSVDTADFVRRSVEASLTRLHIPQVTLLQLHNGLTARRGDEPASLSPADALGPGGVAEAFRRLRDEELVRHVGLTGTGQPEAMRVVIRSGAFDTVQVPYNLLNPSAGSPDPPPSGETDYGNVMADCAALGMGVFAIRVFAGGALLGQPPSAHTLKTPYFPLALFQRDAARARNVAEARAGGQSVAQLAVRFALAHPAVSSAIIGFGSPAHVAELLPALEDEASEATPGEQGT
jgi:L-galactose dehydrogenase/L-glyceraldehyde 3-phosphate reductase